MPLSFCIGAFSLLFMVLTELANFIMPRLCRQSRDFRLPHDVGLIGIGIAVLFLFFGI